jgi:hypothetical protein
MKGPIVFTAPDPVASGKPFDVLAVHGHAPDTLDDFVGDAVFTLHWAEEDRLIAGCGVTAGETVRFIEKDVANGGRDVRVWTIGSSEQPGQFIAWTTR